MKDLLTARYARDAENTELNIFIISVERPEMIKPKPTANQPDKLM